MSSIDNRIVNMHFNNSNFESGVKTTLDSLKKLNESLKMKNAVDGLSEVDRSMKKIGNNSMSGLSSGIDSVINKFSTMNIVGMTAIANITNSAINAGKNLAKSLTIDPIATGFQEYETKINAIQTILTNTAHQGTKLIDVTRALDELNVYADKTIYNFAEMTKNIGTFTAAGIDLKTSVEAIKGISNLAAGSGSTPQQAATAMYQLSQALAAGKVSLMDWNSVVNAGMGGKLFQDELIATAKSMGIVVEAGKPFRETLQDGWLTSEVLTKTLQKFANDPSLTQAATQVKTLSGLLDTMKESVQSGWAQSMEYIFGNKDQAAELFTSISDGFNSIIGPSTEARNTMLKFWNEAGGRSEILKGLGNIMETIGKALGAVRDGFRDVFPPMTGKKLVEISKSFRKLTENFKMSDKVVDAIRNTFKGFFSILDFGINIVKNILNAFSPAFGIFSTLGELILSVTSTIGKLFSSINNAAKSSGIFTSFSNTIKSGLEGIGNLFDSAVKGIDKFFEALTGMNFKPIFDTIGDIGSGLGSGLSSIFGGIGEALSNVNINSVFAAFGTIAAGKGLVTIKSISKNISDMFGSISEISSGLTDTLDAVRNSLEAYQHNLSAGTLIKLATAIGILSLSLLTLSTIEPESMQDALTGLTMLFMELIGGMALLLKVASSNNLKGFFAVSTGLLTLSAGIGILSLSLKSISSLNIDEIAKGVGGVAAMMMVLVAASRTITKDSKGIIKTSIGLVIFSTAIKVLGDSVKSIGSLDTSTIIKGLVGVGVLISELALLLKVNNLNKMSITSATGLMILGGALMILTDSIGELGSMNTDTLVKGLSAVGVALLELSTFTKLMGNSNNLLKTATSMMVLSGAMLVLSKSMNEFSGLSFGDIGRGLLAMGGALVVIGGAIRLMPKTAMITISLGLTVLSGAMMIVSKAMESISSMSWEGIAKGLVTIAGAVTIFAIAMSSMTLALSGATAMLIVSGAMALFIPQLIALSKLNIQQIAIGLGGLAGVFLILGGAGLLLGPVLPVLFSLAGAIGVLSLSTLAAGAGVALFAASLGTLAAVSAGGGFAIIELLRQLMGLLPQLGKKMAESIISFITEIGNGIPKIVEAATNMITGIITAINESLPAIAEVSIKMIEVICTTIGESIPRLIDLGVELIMALIKGVSENIGAITAKAIDIIVEFVNTLSDNIGRIIDAGINLAVNLINGVANGIRNNSPRVTNAFLNLIGACIGAILGTVGRFLSAGVRLVGELIRGIASGVGKAMSAGAQIVKSAITGAKNSISGMVSVGSNMISGFIRGVKNMAGKVVDAAKGVVKGAIDGAKKLLGIHSPSRVFAGIGKYTVMGFSKGISDNVKISNDSVTGMAKDAIDNMKTPLRRVGEILNGEINTTPVITPVVNLNNIKKGSKLINDMLDKDNINIGVGTSGIMTSSIGMIQNDNSSGIISELKNLGKRFNELKSNTTIINGITYDNGSNINNAVESLVRATRLEGRL